MELNWIKLFFFPGIPLLYSAQQRLISSLKVRDKPWKSKIRVHKRVNALDDFDAIPKKVTCSFSFSGAGTGIRTTVV
jgi:hypothetical protein